MDPRTKRFAVAAWTLNLIVTLVAIVVWGQGLRWQFDNLSSYKLFPVLGILAFSLMWSMTIVRFFRLKLGLKTSELKTYYRPTSYMVITLVVLHPTLLVWQLMRDGFGLPPGSYLNHYVGPTQKWAATLGIVSLFIFLAYELRYFYTKHQWWRYIEYIQTLGLAAIFYHSLRLGTNLQQGWFRWVWWFYGLSFVYTLVDFYVAKFKKLDLKSKKAV